MHNGIEMYVVSAVLCLGIKCRRGESDAFLGYHARLLRTARTESCLSQVFSYGTSISFAPIYNIFACPCYNVALFSMS